MLDLAPMAVPAHALRGRRLFTLVPVGSVSWVPRYTETDCRVRAGVDRNDRGRIAKRATWLSIPHVSLRRFREILPSSEWRDSDRARIAAGHAMMRLLASRVDPEIDLEDSDLQMARVVLEVLPPSPALHALGVLLREVDQDPTAPAGPALMTYAESLERECEYDFAADVYLLAAALGRREQGLLLVPPALTHAGECLSWIRRTHEAAGAYRAALVVAQELGDAVVELEIMIAIARFELMHRRADAARAQLDEVIGVARTRDLRYPLALALRERGGLRGRHERDCEGAMGDFAEALELFRNRGIRAGITDKLWRPMRAAAQQAGYVRQVSVGFDD
jgi:tetratricopeptide (TPR) repeat protein